MTNLRTLPRTYTNHFDSMRSACMYYAKKEGLTHDQVRAKFNDGEIFTGYPASDNKHQILGLDGEGRYYTVDRS